MGGRSTRWQRGRRNLHAWALVGVLSAVCLAPGPAARAEGVAPPGGLGAALERCPAELRLVASMVVEARPDLSIAMVRTSAGPGAAMVNVGGRIADYTLVALEGDRAHLRAADGAPCTLYVFAAGARRPEPAPIAPVVSAARDDGEPAPKGKAVFSRSELASGVRPLGGDRYRIDRALFQRALANPGGAAGGAYFRAVERDGRMLGMEVRGVRDPSALSAMGIHTGDVVRSVNGIGLDDAVQLLSALRTAREAEQVTLRVSRGGEEHTFQYQIE